MNITSKHKAQLETVLCESMYDELNRVVEKIDSLNHSTKYRYDLNVSITPKGYGLSEESM